MVSSGSRLRSRSSCLLSLVFAMLASVIAVGEARAGTPPSRRIEINVPAFNLYLYEGEELLATYPVAVGRPVSVFPNRTVVSETPAGTFVIATKVVAPTWYPPLWLKRERGWPSDYKVPPGPDNPLGSRWLGIQRPGVSGYGIHGTNDPDSIGRAVTLGCIRLRNEDVEELFDLVKVGTPVSIVQEPAGAGAKVAGAAVEWLPGAGGTVEWLPGEPVTEVVYGEGGAMVSLADLPMPMRRYIRRDQSTGDTGELFVYGRPLPGVEETDGRLLLPLDDLAARFGMSLVWDARRRHAIARPGVAAAP